MTPCLANCRRCNLRSVCSLSEATPLTVGLTSPTVMGKRLVDRFGLAKDLTPYFLTVSRRIQLTSDISPLLQEAKIISSSTDSTVAGYSGFVDVYEVPTGKRVILGRNLQLTRTSGDNKIDQLRVRDTSEGSFLAFAFTSATSKDFNPTEIDSFTLEEGDKLQINFDGSGVAATIFRVDVSAIQESAF